MKKNLFNGNIGAMVTTITNPTTRAVLPMGNVYFYDQLNRLSQARSFDNLNVATNAWGTTGTVKYYNAFTYDANGNIKTQVRHDENNTIIDNLTYNYHKNSDNEILRNRLYSVNDLVLPNAHLNDIDDMGVFTQDGTINTANNYSYDQEGRLIKDLQEEISNIVWRVDGKVKKIVRPTNSQKKNLSFD